MLYTGNARHSYQHRAATDCVLRVGKRSQGRGRGKSDDAERTRGKTAGEESSKKVEERWRVSRRWGKKGVEERS